ncbi:type I glyceraldehyde-3-phosphate dehydrogenase [Candidatus Falkowbacteria bacterium CG10_big_fil_rev_8_21_14_0_10_39_9]|uniref:Glyceraldehyde-3-phosphate dehydrogenase n=1 Tax=Candidatus Falkowbacteria bacterium CG10_big_fil_rev_8_21_14_0_10_39_9 TaxID=1974566 RepID=A0A2M6WQT2_9BACT|nr:MAG: type I glyceraldehyde-3-phosphate dehydrogenase [Candidatus Falkowbacteria bacterium CG10_big_fil_rev_8_21_14_0_10_39_9]
MIKLAINGFGRIGRATFKIILEKYPEVRVVAINDLTDTKTLAHLLKYDSCYGIYGTKVDFDAKHLLVKGQKIPVLAEKDPALLPWQKLGVDVVLECTGRFTNKEGLSFHLHAGAKKVILSAPAKGKEDKVKTVVLGVNEDKITQADKLLSCASCTTNCLAPVSDVVRQYFGIKKAIMTTIHSYTADQNLVDGPHKDLRRARAAALNMVPTTTGAALSVTETIPSLKNKFDGLAVRVPTPVGSLCDIVFVTKKKVTVEKVSEVFKKVAKLKRYQGIIQASEEPLVSSDIVGNPYSAIVDLPMTKVVDGDLLKVTAWYDNEWGYSNRLADLAVLFTKK